MQQHGIRPDQIMQVRGFADQKLRKSDAPLDPSNRRVSVIVEYLKKTESAPLAEESATGMDAKAGEAPGGSEEQSPEKH
jgi:chemotaxis protein MotB